MHAAVYGGAAAVILAICSLPLLARDQPAETFPVSQGVTGFQQPETLEVLLLAHAGQLQDVDRACCCLLCGGGSQTGIRALVLATWLYGHFGISYYPELQIPPGARFRDFVSKTTHGSHDHFPNGLFLSLHAVPASESGAGRSEPLNNSDPLSEAVAQTFKNGAYTQFTLNRDTTMYRVYGGSAGELGSYWTTRVPYSPLQSSTDDALNPAWRNTALSASRVVVPKGTVVYEGIAAPQAGLPGGGSQIYIPKVNPAWLKP